MKIQIAEKTLEWILFFHKKFPKNIFASEDARTPFIIAGTSVNTGLERKIKDMIDRSGLPFIEVKGEAELEQLVVECYKPKEEEATALLKNARRFLGDIFYKEIKFVNQVTYDDLHAFYERNLDVLKNDPLMGEALVNVMEFEKEKFSHLANVFYLAMMFFQHWNHNHKETFDLDLLWPGILLHDVGKPKHHYSYKIADKEVYQFQYIKFEEIKIHPLRGWRILQHPDSVQVPHESLEIIYRHHQRPKGGYPDREAGDVIPDHVHLFTIPDMYEQMLTKIVKEMKWTKELVIRKLEVDARKKRIHAGMWEAFKGFLTAHDREAVAIIKKLK